MSTTFGEIKCYVIPDRRAQVYTSLMTGFVRAVRVFIYDEPALGILAEGKKITLTEETWRELITALETAGNSIGWKQ